MPYIKEKYRTEVQSDLDHLVFNIIKIRDENNLKDMDLLGILNYCITTLILLFVSRTAGKIRYYLIAGITGVLENVKQEFYRKVAAGYEDVKEEEEGEVGYSRIL